MREKKIINVLSLRIGDWVIMGGFWVEVQCLRGVFDQHEGLMVEISGHGCYRKVKVKNDIIILRNV